MENICHMQLGSDTQEAMEGNTCVAEINLIQ